VSDSRSPSCCMDKHGYGSVLIHNLQKAVQLLLP